MIKEIKFTGLRHQPSAYDCQDGTLDYVANAVNGNGYITSIDTPNEVLDLSKFGGHEVLYIHKENYILRVSGGDAEGKKGKLQYVLTFLMYADVEDQNDSFCHLGKQTYTQSVKKAKTNNFISNSSIFIAQLISPAITTIKPLPVLSSISRTETLKPVGAPTLDLSSVKLNCVFAIIIVLIIAAGYKEFFKQRFRNTTRQQIFFRLFLNAITLKRIKNFIKFFWCIVESIISNINFFPIIKIPCHINLQGLGRPNSENIFIF